MLHVFHLNVGRQFNLDVAYSAQPVDHLQGEVERLTDVPKYDQILLISGGVVLAPEKYLSSYTSAGSESNPIYLVSRLRNSCAGSQPPPCDEDDLQPMIQAISELEKEVSALHRQPFRLNNAAVAAQQSERLQTTSQRVAEVCHQLVAEQHHIYQGWCSVVANLDDTIAAFQRHIRKLCRKRDLVAQSRTVVAEMLQKLPVCLEMLRRLPLIRPLMEMNPLAGSRCRNSSGESTCSSLADGGSAPLPSLLAWISAKEPTDRLEDMDLANLGVQIEQDMAKVLDESVLNSLEQWERFTVSRGQDVQMKEIRGITQRFAQLNNFMQKIGERREDQCNFAQCVRTHELNIRACSDSAVQSDAYARMGNFLEEMAKNAKWMLDVAKKFGFAKQELLSNIRRRLEWVIETHEYIHAADTEVFVHREWVNRLIRRLELLKQLRSAPYLYAQCVAEINRRQTLRRQFMEWAKQVASRSSRLHCEESRHRKELSNRLEAHFLGTLFQCLEKTFPVFAVEPPESFDSALPFIEYEHLEQIRSSVPELGNCLRLSSSLNDSYGAVSKTESNTHRVLFYSSTPPSSDDQLRTGGDSPSFFHSIENIPFSTFASLSQKTNSEADLSSGDTPTKRMDEFGSPAEGSSRPTFQRSAPISIPSRTVHCSNMSLFPRLPSSLSSCGSATSLPQPERFFTAGAESAAQPFEIQFDTSESVGGRTYDLHTLSPDFIAVSPLPGELHDSLFAPVDNAKHTQLLEQFNSTTAELVKAKAELTSSRAELDRWADQLKSSIGAYRLNTDFALTDIRRTFAEMTQWIGHEMETMQSVGSELIRRASLAVQQSPEHQTSAKVAQNLSKSECLSDFEEARNVQQMVQSDEQLQNFGSIKSGLSFSQCLFDDVGMMNCSPFAVQSKSDDLESLRQSYRLKLTELKTLRERIDKACSGCVPRSLSLGDGLTEELMSPVLLRQPRLFLKDDFATIRSCVEALLDNVSADCTTTVFQNSTCCTQTDFDYRISVVTIEPGDTVLVIYEPTMGTFALFCLPKISYVLTDSSVRKLGLSKEATAEQCTWTFGRVVKKQLCQTKKPANRYNLPVGAKFYRVNVEPISGADNY